MRKLSAWCFDHRLTVVGLWLVGLVVVFGGVGAIGATYDATFDLPDSDSAAGVDVLDRYFPDLGAGGQSGTIVFRADQGIDDPEVTAAMEELFALADAGFPDAQGVPRFDGVNVVSPYTDQGAAQVATQGPLAGELAYAHVHLAADIDFTESVEIGAAIVEHAPALDGLDVYPGGIALAASAPPESELIGLGFAVVILVVAFGSVMAMGLSLVVALTGIGAGIGLVLLVSNLYAVPDFTPTVGVMIGLGVGIDYALLIVTRYREGTQRGLPPREATMAAMGTAGRAVLFAGATVVISLLGMLLIGLRLISGVGVGASLTVLLTMVSSVTLLPALLGLAHDRVEVTRWRGLLTAALVAVALLAVGLGWMPVAAVAAVGAVMVLLASLAVRPLRAAVPRRPAKPVEATVAHRWSRTIQRRPWLWLGAGTLLLLIIASPVLSLRLGTADEGNFPDESYTRRAYDLLAEGFGVGFNGPILVTVVPGPDDGPGSVESVEALREALSASPGVTEVSPAVADDPTAADPGAYLMTLVPATAPDDEATVDLVNILREDAIPAAVAGTDLDVHLTGVVATNIDITSYVTGRVPVFVGVVLALSFLLLAVVFRSVLVPVKAVVMNVLSIAATYGVLVAVFQWGWGGGLIGVAGAPIEPVLPLFVFAVVFGLSMDYEVFLLSRIREEYARTGDPTSSVADGLAATAKVITAAAAIMVMLFGSFVFEPDRLVKMLGLSLATAVLLDATLVRMLLVPAAMELLGARNWWMPRWLDRLLPHLAVEGRRESSLGTAPVARGGVGSY